MFFGNSNIKKCSECSCLIEEPQLISGNTFGAVYWTDGKMEAPMLPDEPKLVKCPQCKALVWIEDLQEVEEPDHSNPEIVKEMQNYIDPSADDYFRVLEKGISTSKKEFYIRIQAWWAGNDHRRRSNAKKPLSEDELRNLLALAEMLEDTDDDSRIMKAEIFRELGLYKDAYYFIPECNGKEPSTAVATILGLLETKQSHVAEINYNQRTSSKLDLDNK